MNSIKGICVSKGNACGIVENCNYNTEITGDKSPVILVLENLDRDILTSLRKNVVGVISEHGNIGSHGAGILRDLKIPCIIRIKNATKILHPGEYVEINGKENCILCNHSEMEDGTLITAGSLYNKVMSRRCNISDIRPDNRWVCRRPQRSYQRLRFDIISPVYKEMPCFLFNMKPAMARQQSTGALEEFGNPVLEDVCSFVINNPNWLIEMAQKRTKEIREIKTTLRKYGNVLQSEDISDFYRVFCMGVTQYRKLFKYAFMSQAISDEILEIYGDFIEMILGYRKPLESKDLYSDYVNRCLKSQIDPGISQRWSLSTDSPHIWDGELLEQSLPEDLQVIAMINSCENKEDLYKDYSSFRTIVPLIYQLSEEFFYVSSSINSYIKWSIQKLYSSSIKLQKIANGIDAVYEIPLNQFQTIIEEENKWNAEIL